MKINSDFRDLLQNLNAAGMRRLILGGYALMVHTSHAKRRILSWIAPTAHLPPPAHQSGLGIGPIRADILTTVSGVDFPGGWERRVAVDIVGVAVPVLSPQDLQRDESAR